MNKARIFLGIFLMAAAGCGRHDQSLNPQTYSASAAGAFTVQRSGHPNDWDTMGYDLARSGYNPNESTIGTGSFGTLHELWSAKIGGEVGEPMLATGVMVKGVATDILYLAIGGGKIVARNADTGAFVWSKNLSVSTYSCGGMNKYEFGANAAPVIDRKTGRIYVADGINQVHALSLSAGKEQPGWPIAIAPYTHDDFMYAGLTYNPANQTLYAETSSTCDISPWYGRISAIDTANATILNTFFPTQGTSGGGIWGFGGASVDSATNDVFIAVGNADTGGGVSQHAYYAEQVVELSHDVSTVIANNYPELVGSGDDLDFGATPMLFEPPGCPPLLAAINKDGVLYLYDRSAISSGPVQSVQMGISSDNSDFVGLPAYDPVTNDLYVEQSSTFGIYKPGMAAFAMQSNCKLNPTPVWAANFGSDGATTDDDTLRSPISIANGVVYVSDYVTKQTYAFNAMSGAQLWTTTLGGPGVTGPVVANGKLYIGSLGTTMTAWSP